MEQPTQGVVALCLGGQLCRHGVEGANFKP